MNYYLSALKKYTVISGRASRAEYWYFFLFNIIISFGLAIIDGLLGISSLEDESSILLTVFQWAVAIPSFTVGVRRMHDVNKSGWFLAIPFYDLVLLVTDGTKGDNKYGPDPKAVGVK